MTQPVTLLAQRRPETLLDQSLALGVYFESLLCETPQAICMPTTTVTDTSPVIAAAVTPLPAMDTPFQVLLFRVAGLTLAVPLAELNGVLPWPRCVTPMPGHTPFFIGVTTHLGRQVKIVDTGHLVAPVQQRRLQHQTKMALRHIVLMGGGEWGMACEDIAEVLTLAPGEVRWRATRTERPWAAGTVTDHLCVLLDTCALAAELKGRGIGPSCNIS